MARKIQERYAKTEAREQELKNELRRKNPDASLLFFRKFGGTPLRALAKRAKGLLEITSGGLGTVEYLSHGVALGWVNQYAASWQRPLEDWKPRGKAGASQVHSLIQHLFCKYPMPFFLIRLWGSDGDSGRAAEKMVVFLGKGGSLAKGIQWGSFNHRSCIFPPLTRKQCHLFLSLRGEFSLPEAVRTTQVLSHGGSSRLAAEVAAAWPHLAGPEEEEFTAQFILWICNQGMFDLNQIRPISDFIRHQRTQDPAWSLSGRTFDSVLKAASKWHKELQLLKKAGQWASSGIRGYRSHDVEDFDQDLVWTCVELTSHKELSEEGVAMGHCVASYGHNASLGKISIWSLRKGKERRLTIEVHHGTKSIVQARGRFNDLAKDAELTHLKRWSNQAGLKIAARL